MKSYIKELKGSIRRKIWSEMERRGIARFPTPLTNRIPNFQGAEEAANRLTQMNIFKKAKVVKVNPDSPQLPVRRLVLMSNKILIVPTPRLHQGFLLLDPNTIPKYLISRAVTIRGLFIYGRFIKPWNLPNIDLIVVGSVAVNVDGIRIGKGGGYAELEYAILREFDKVHDLTPIVTTVHDIQVINNKIPKEPHDLVVDYIVTPTRIIEVKSKDSKPKGIIWDLITQDKLREIPILKEIASRKGIRLKGTKDSS